MIKQDGLSLILRGNTDQPPPPRGGGGGGVSDSPSQGPHSHPPPPQARSGLVQGEGRGRVGSPGYSPPGSGLVLGGEGGRWVGSPGYPSPSRQDLVGQNLVGQDPFRMYIQPLPGKDLVGQDSVRMYPTKPSPTCGQKDRHLWKHYLPSYVRGR